MQNATLPEVLARLQEFYGRPMTAAPDVALRVRAAVDWDDATLGQATRAVARAYRLNVVTEANGTIRFVSGLPTESGPTLSAQGLSVTLTGITQSETRSQNVGAGGVELQKSLRLDLRITDESGEPRRPRVVVKGLLLNAVGRQIELSTADGLSKRGSTGFPDEDRHTLRLPLGDQALSDFTRLELEVRACRSVIAHHVELSFRDPSHVPALAGPVELSFQRRGTQATGLIQVDLVLRGSTEQSLDLSPLAPGDLLVFARQPGGTLVPVPIKATKELLLSPGPSGSVVSLSPIPANTEALICHVTERSLDYIHVPFRFTNLRLPLDEIASLPVVRNSGAMRLTIPDALPNAGIAIGLARRLTRGWGPIRWTTHNLDNAGALRVEGLPPGAYRVIATQHEVGTGTLIKRQFQARQLATISITAGREAQLTLVSVPAVSAGKKQK